MSNINKPKKETIPLPAAPPKLDNLINKKTTGVPPITAVDEMVIGMGQQNLAIDSEATRAKKAKETPTSTGFEKISEALGFSPKKDTKPSLKAEDSTLNGEPSTRRSSEVASEKPIRKNFVDTIYSGIEKVGEALGFSSKQDTKRHEKDEDTKS